MKGAIMRHHLPALLAGALLFFAGCGGAEDESAAGLKVFTGATVFDGQGGPPIENAADNRARRPHRCSRAGRNGRRACGRGGRSDLAGKFVTPGFSSDTDTSAGARGLETGPDVYTRENTCSTSSRSMRATASPRFSAWAATARKRRGCAASRRPPA